MQDLTSLMQIAPYNAAFMIGQNQGQDLQMNQLKQMELAQLMQTRAGEESRAQGREPYELDRLGLANETARTEMPGKAATARSLGYDADIKQQTMGSTVANTNNDNHVKVLTRAAQTLAAFTNNLDNYTDAEKPLALAKTLSGLGLPPEATQIFMDNLSKVPASQLKGKLTELTQRMAQMQPEYIKEMDKQTLEGKQKLEQIGATGNEQRRTEQMKLNAQAARVTAAKKGIDDYIAQAKTPREKMTRASTAYELVKDTNPDLAMTYLNMYRSAQAQAEDDDRAAAARTPRLDIPATAAAGTPQAATVPSRTAPITPGLAPASAPQKTPSLADLQKAYPGVSPEVLKQRYKQVHGVDIK